MSEKIVITGAAGFLGNNLVRELVRQGRHVVALVHDDDRSLRDINVEIVRGDVTDRQFVENSIGKANVVYHLAALISVHGRRDYAEMKRVNVSGTQNVVAACIKGNVKRLVHVSSVHAYSHLPMDQAVNESRPLAHDSIHLPYDRTKAAGQQIVMKASGSGLNAISINPTWILGPNDYRPSPAGEFFLQLASQRMLALVDAGYYCVDVRDVVDVLIQAESRGSAGEAYLLPGRYAKFNQLADWQQLVTGVKPPKMVFSPRLAAMAAGFIETGCYFFGRRPFVSSDAIKIVQRHQSIETDKAARTFGFTSRDLEQSVVDTVTWLVRHHKGAKK